MNRVDELLNTHPLFELKDKLLSLTGKMERIHYLSDPKWGVIRALAELHEIPGGMQSYTYLLEQIDEIVKGNKVAVKMAVKSMIAQIKNEELSASVTPGSDVKELERKDRGEIIANHKNIKWLLKNHKDLVGLFGWDLFTKRVWLMRDPPWGYHDEIPPILQKPFGYKPPIGNEVFNICALLNDEDMSVIPEHVVQGAIEDVARENKFDFLIKYVESLPPWDGEARLYTFAERYFHLNRLDLLAEEIRLINKMFAKFVIGMMARCYEPGCVMKGMLCLRGAQHIGKSGLLRVLFYPFAREHSGKSLDMGDPDLFHKLTSAWGIELGELAGVYGREIETVKNFVSTMVDIFRRKFHREELEIARRYVIATTYNIGDTDPLQDNTGNVRKWLIPFGNREYEILDFVGITTEMLQIKAEALHYYKNGESWELDDRDDQRVHSGLLVKTDGDNPASYYIDQYLLNGGGAVTSKEGFHIEELKNHLYNHSPGAQKIGPRDLGRGLKACGLESGRVYRNGKQVTLWFYKGDYDKIKQYWSSTGGDK